MTIGTKIIAIDCEVANNEITNEDLTKILDTSDEWITTRTGIKKRRVLSDNETSVDLGIKVAKKIVQRADFNPLDFDMIIAASSAPEEVFPSVSCRIQGAIGAKNAACFDVKAACAGFIYALNIANALIKSGLYKNILIVATDATTKFTDWTDRSICVLFGDGAGAAIVCADENQDDIVGIDLIADGSCADYITLKTQGKNCPLVNPIQDEVKPFIQMKGKDVYKFVMQTIPPKLEELMHKTNTTIDDIDYFIPHQSNQRMIDALAQRLNIDNSKVISNIEHYGNMSAASILVAIREGIDKGELKLPATVMLSAFGAGMSAGNAIIKLEKNI
ncbi:MAG: ketoacyl-ACP synthase III [Cyanobacteria bacterium SIG27]|nr:ketoacyl-ACP synthase III [Cyanobacteria bacterium SIG27]MBQ9150364.1 ketoacyl-ACP synthase III [bacterium]